MLESEKKYERTGKKFEKGVQNADCVRFLRANVRSACGCHTHTHTQSKRGREKERKFVCGMCYGSYNFRVVITARQKPILYCLKCA